MGILRVRIRIVGHLGSQTGDRDQQREGWLDLRKDRWVYDIMIYNQWIRQTHDREKWKIMEDAFVQECTDRSWRRRRRRRILLQPGNLLTNGYREQLCILIAARICIQHLNRICWCVINNKAYRLLYLIIHSKNIFLVIH